jgi:hypothetical protein
METFTNIDVHVARFLTATAAAKPEDTITAPLFYDDPTETFLDALKLYQALQGDETDSNSRKDYFSLSRWNGGHTEYHHEGTSCLTLEYDTVHAPVVKAALEELEMSHYVIPTKSGRKKTFLFAIPCVDGLDVTDTTRAASLIAELIQQSGLVHNSWLYTYFFRFRTDQEITFTPGKLMTSQFVRDANSAKVKCFIHTWSR